MTFVMKTADLSTLYVCVCMQDIETSRSLPGQNVYWYIISDSLEVRLWAREKYGLKVIIDTNKEATHPDCMHHKHQICTKESIVDSIRWAASQLEVFRRMNHHVVTFGSGFGMVGAWLSEDLSRTYVVEKGKNRTCKVSEYDSRKDLSLIWQGIHVSIIYEYLHSLEKYILFVFYPGI